MELKIRSNSSVLKFTRKNLQNFGFEDSYSILNTQNNDRMS